MSLGRLATGPDEIVPIWASPRKSPIAGKRSESAPQAEASSVNSQGPRPGNRLRREKPRPLDQNALRQAGGKATKLKTRYSPVGKRICDLLPLGGSLR